MSTRTLRLKHDPEKSCGKAAEKCTNSGDLPGNLPNKLGIAGIHDLMKSRSAAAVDTAKAADDRWIDSVAKPVLGDVIANPSRESS